MLLTITNGQLRCYTFTFFSVIDKKYNSNNYDWLSENFIDLCEKVIVDHEIFYELVDITFNVMRDFYCDSFIKDVIGDNLLIFLKGTIENNTRVEDILVDKIENRI